MLGPGGLDNVMLTGMLVELMVWMGPGGAVTMVAVGGVVFITNCGLAGEPLETLPDWSSALEHLQCRMALRR